MDKKRLDYYKKKLVSRREERSEEHTSELQSPCNLVCRLLLEKKKPAAASSHVLALYSRASHRLPPSRALCYCRSLYPTPVRHLLRSPSNMHSLPRIPYPHAR